MAGPHDDPPLEARPPSKDDLVALCRELNRLGASYIVIGGFALIHAGYPRFTGDIDLLVEDSAENEQRVFLALKTLPDQAVNELKPGELAQYAAIRIADDIIVDLMTSAGGIDFHAAHDDVVVREVDGVKIPFASPRLLWRMKSGTHRSKDDLDLVFLREYFASRGETPS